MVVTVGERWFLGDFVSGAPLMDLQPESGRWSRAMANSTISCALTGSAAHELAALVTPWQHYLAVDHGGQVTVAGPILSDTWRDGQLTLAAKGAEAYVGRREVMPVRMPEYGWQFWDDARQEPAHWARTIVGLAGDDPRTLPAAVAWVITQAVNFPHSPAVRGVDNWDPGTQTLWVEGIDHRTVREVIDDLTRESGAEWDLVPEWVSANREAVQWQILVGDPLVRSHRKPAWSDRTISGLETVRDGSQMVTHQHVTGQAGHPLSVTEVAPAGWPIMLESTFSSRHTEDDPARLRKWAGSLLAADAKPWVTAAFDAPTRDLHLWSLGDEGHLTATSPHLPAYTTVRVASVSGQLGADTVRVQCHPTVAEV